MLNGNRYNTVAMGIELPSVYCSKADNDYRTANMLAGCLSSADSSTRMIAIETNTDC
jgi:hypothetical protein